MQTTDEKRLERVLGTLEEATAALREANDRMERVLGIEPPRPRPALTLVENESASPPTRPAGLTDRSARIRWANDPMRGVQHRGPAGRAWRAERRPCPSCSSLVRTHEGSSSMGIGVSSSVEAKVERGLNETRLAVLGILVGISLAVGFGFPGPREVKLAAAVGSFAVACLAIRLSWSRHYLMAFMHWLTGR